MMADYDPKKDSAESYDEAVKAIRMEKINAVIAEHRITLDWPPKELSPNNPSWRSKISPKKKYRANCHNLARSQGLGKINADKVQVNIIFTPPDNRKRDDDNMIGSFKAGRDAIADLIGIDDANWQTSYAFLPSQKPGKIELTIREA